MIDPKMFEEMCNKFSELIAASPARDIEKNLKSLLGGFFEKLDLITREEFEVQAQLLARTREKLDALEKRIEALESPASGSPNTPA